MIQNILSHLFTLIVGQASACPLCLGQNPNDKYYFMVIVGFILIATVVILYLLNVCLKYKNVNNSSDT